MEGLGGFFDFWGDILEGRAEDLRGMGEGLEGDGEEREGVEGEDRMVKEEGEEGEEGVLASGDLGLQEEGGDTWGRAKGTCGLREGYNFNRSLANY